MGGDFNACVGSINSDGLTFLPHVGPVGMGQGNARGTMLIHSILQSKFYIFRSHFGSNMSKVGSRPCSRFKVPSCVRSLRHAAFASSSGYLENTDHSD